VVDYESSLKFIMLIRYAINHLPPSPSLRGTPCLPAGRLLQKEERLRLIISNIRINKSVTEILKYNTAGRQGGWGKKLKKG